MIAWCNSCLRDKNGREGTKVKPFWPFLFILSAVLLAGCTSQVIAKVEPGQAIDSSTKDKSLASSIGQEASPPSFPAFLPPTSTITTPTPVPTPEPTATSTPVPVIPKEALWMKIPAIGVDAGIVEVGLEPDGAMGSPPNGDLVGIYSGGPGPGMRGNVLLDGHYDYMNPRTGVAQLGVFYRLKDLKPGAQVIIATQDNTYTYVVTKSLLYRYDDPAALEVLMPGDEPIITMITCEGAFDQATRLYSHRRVVVARLEE